MLCVSSRYECVVTERFVCGYSSRYECVEWAVGLSGRHKAVRGVRKADGKTVLIRQLSTRDKA